MKYQSVEQFSRGVKEKMLSIEMVLKLGYLLGNQSRLTLMKTINN